ncbi:hypothetical protein LK540_16500 [Massilia sp. IC2-278]|uniref:hypothetical protein n=1 Tax=Massilia sp. IC2-278 TaxID=2887200 RepID=UPI001E29C7A5|nr:hypothetical protein [Massilia sp. IC2-278]MCC2962030.1 hypothetical protein [Massilia sp. IC2-278]
MAGARFLWMALLFPFSGKAWALCEGGHPNLPLVQEMREARFVVIAQPQTFTRVQDLAEDPEGYTATRVRLKVDEVLYGKTPAEVKGGLLDIVEPNTSARFGLDERDAGKPYLLFVYAGEDGHWVNACGHSGELASSRATLRQVRGIAADRR